MTMEAAPDQGENRQPSVSRPKRLRSRVTNGTSLFAEGDQQSPWARRLRDVIDLHVSDQGGPDNLSEARRSLIRRAATITTELERLEARFASDKALKDDFATYQAGANSLRRILEAIGLDRVSRDVTPSLGAYLASRQPIEAAP
jgi:hypothetical protein